MNPLSPITYYHRHKRNSLLLVSIIALATAGLFVMVAVLDSIPTRARFSYLTKVSRIYPAIGDSLEPGIISQVQLHPDVAHLIWDNGLEVYPPTLIGVDNVRLMGLSQEDAIYLMAHFGVRLKEGRMFESRKNEFLLSEEVVRALELRIGDTIERSLHDRYFGNIPAPLVLVGILEGDPEIVQGPSVRVGFASHEYLENHEGFAPRSPNLLVLPQEGRKEALDEFLETSIASERTETETYREVSRLVTIARQGLFLLSGIVNCLVTVVVAVVIGVINRIALVKRLPEFGLLYAVGYQKRRLIGRLTSETAAMAGIGWIFGLGLSSLILAVLKASMYYDIGMELDLANPMPFMFSLPIPLVVVAYVGFSAARVFARLDAIAIVERGKLSLEMEDRERKANRSSAKPLSSRTFYLRHPRRGFLLVMAIALMILGIAFPGFLIFLPMNTMFADIEYLHYVSGVFPSVGNSVDPGVAAQIRSHPAVAGVIQTMPLGMQVLIPPLGETQVPIYGASETDLPKLMDLFGTQLVEGRLPRPRSNEILISRAIALNRGLQLGDTLGRPIQGDKGETALLVEDDIPTAMVLVGLLSGDDLWLGLASLEYLQSHELSVSRQTWMLAIPYEGSKLEFDTWLEESIASARTGVHTYDARLRDHQHLIRGMLLLFAGVECLIAFVAAIAMAILNHIFFIQRREEFGILHAVGWSRPWLVLRTARETGSLVGIAWLIGALICLVGLLIAQATIYAPRGLALEFLNPVPWLYTLPIPFVVIVVSTGTIAHTLRKLDPVSIIERRS